MKNSRNDQNQYQKSELITNECDKKNQNSYEFEESDSRSEKFSYFLNEKKYHIDTELITQKIFKIHKCRKCKKNFASNNKLHQHVRECRQKSRKEILSIETFHIDETHVNRIIISSTKFDLTKNLVFRSWHFVTFLDRISKNASLNELCVDTDCIMSLIDRAYLQKFLSSTKILHTDDFISVRDIDIVIHNCSEYVHLKLFISESFEIVKLTRQAHIVDNLRAKFLMSMNILRLEEIILDISRRRLILSLCENLKMSIRVISKSKFRINRLILVERQISISAKSVISISIRMKDSLSDRDYLFQSVTRDLNLDSIEEVMTHMMNVNLAAVQICNFTNKSVIISRKARLNRLIEYEEHECYLTDSIETILTAESSWRKNEIIARIHISSKRDMKDKFSIEIIVYETSSVRQQLFDVTKRYSLWDKIENTMINVLQKKWMSVTLKSKVKIEAAKMYSMRSKKKKLIDEIFNKLHEQRKMHWTKKSIAHEASVFVVWRQMSNDEKKNRVVIDIRDFNKIVEFDSYSMFLQVDIIFVVTNSRFISIIDAAAFFYQFRVRSEDRHKLTVMSHREQEYFFVAFMNFKNSSAYAQRRIDIILRDLKYCCRAFIDDITIFSSTLEKHLRHLSVIFQRLLDYDIRLNSCKTFLSFSSIALLEQHVDDLDLHAIKDKIAAILNWKFSKILKALKIYLEFIEWLRDYVTWYAQKAESLQQRKIMLLKRSSQKESARRIFSCKILFQFIERELKSFELVQFVFKNSQFLTHFNLMRQFLIDVDVFKKDFEAFVYHIKKERDDMTKSIAIESIVFLSKTLTSVEKRYWSTKLKVIAVIWIVKKLHHMIRAFKQSTIIWTNHSATTIIVKQIKLSIINTNKLNLRLIRVAMYLSQFDLNIRHKAERDHVISNVLSRLSCFDEEKFTRNEDDDTLDDVEAYVETLMKMFIIFKERLIQVYKTNREWSTLYELLATVSLTQAIWRNINIMRKSQNIAQREIEFERRDDLIYHLDRATFKARLCISKSLIQNIFKMTHDDLAHVEFHRAHIIISETLYIRRLAHYLRQYIEYCSKCLLNQIKRHRSYDALIFISSSKISFYIITMNFVLALSQSKQEKFDTLLIVTNKFSKDKLLISRQNTWKAQDWAVSLWKYLQLCNWRLSRVIIFDRDAKFRFDMWKFLFKTIETDLLTSTIYHSQTDDQSERINQTIEIALRYLLTSNSNLSWHEALSSLQHDLMNFIIFTSFTSNQTLYEVNIRLSLMMLNDHTVDSTFVRKFIRKKVANVIDFANTRFKIIYDDKHKSLAFNSENKVYLRLHHEYSLFEKENFKLSSQRFDSYTVKRKVDNVVYELNLSFNIRIHSIISIAQLEFVEDDLDSYNRSRSTNSESVKMINENTQTKRSYEVKRILKERMRKYEKITVKQYLIKWKDWESKHNIWKSEKDCENVKHLIAKFHNRQV